MMMSWILGHTDQWWLNERSMGLHGGVKYSEKLSSFMGEVPTACTVGRQQSIIAGTKQHFSVYRMPDTLSFSDGFWPTLQQRTIQ